MITANDILAWRPCPAYPGWRVKQLVGAGVTPEQVATAAEIPIDDRIWVLTHYAACTAPTVLVTWAADCAEHVVGLAGPAMAQAQAAIAAARAWVAEPTRKHADNAYAALARAAAAHGDLLAADAAISAAASAASAAVEAFYLVEADAGSGTAEYGAMDLAMFARRTVCACAAATDSDVSHLIMRLANALSARAT